jgi:hypothetical protein
MESLVGENAADVTSRYPVGAQVPVYYRPEEPEFAVLEPGVQSDTLFALPFSVLLLLGGSAFLYTLRPRRRKADSPMQAPA